ncbi:MAG TPA: maleylacetoacetate isomerase [Bdellovibrionales bacterium]|nr:maleylacetoacetate isomerase [Bdellovibrionales bacterium]
MANDVILYSYFRSSAAFRVRTALNLKGIPYEQRAVHLVNNGGEQYKDEYTKVNPMNEVPALVHNGRAIGQSVAIIEYLDAVWPSPRLYPADPYRAALVRQAVENVNAGVHPVQNLKVLNELERRFGLKQEGKNEWAAYWIDRGFRGIERFLSKNAGHYSVGDEVTAADLYLIPQVLNARRYNVDLTPFPTIQRVEAACMRLEAFIRAHPRNQPDTPDDQK